MISFSMVYFVCQSLRKVTSIARNWLYLRYCQKTRKSYDTVWKYSWMKNGWNLDKITNFTKDEVYCTIINLTENIAVVKFWTVCTHLFCCCRNDCKPVSKLTSDMYIAQYTVYTEFNIRHLLCSQQKHWSFDIVTATKQTAWKHNRMHYIQYTISL